MTQYTWTWAGLWLLLSLSLPLPHVRCDVDDIVADTCVIRATLYMTPPAQRSASDFGLPLDIDCAPVGNGSSDAAVWDVGGQRVAGKAHVLLDGSQAPLLSAAASYGLQYLQNCAQLQSLQIEHFALGATRPLSCAGSALQQLTEVRLQHNELGMLSAATFQQTPNLLRLHLEHNYLHGMEMLLGCEQLQQLTCVAETELALSDGQALARLQQLERLQLGQLKRIHAAFFETLPGKLTELLLHDTPIEGQEARILGGRYLINVTMVRCQLLGFVLRQPGGAHLARLNLSGNALQHLELDVGATLLSLDLSDNRLERLNMSWFEQLPQLRVLQLQQNRLHALSLTPLLRLHTLNLRDNRLERLEYASNAALEQATQLRIQIDRNPWSCQWLLSFTHAQPQMFRLFQYDKYISQINVNGLSCRAQEQAATTTPSSATLRPFKSDLELNATQANITKFTVIYGNPLHHKRSQRSGALVIVFMLPLGIALLFLLLYLYLHCERLFHLSYYISGLHCFGKRTQTQRFVDHVDIVRYPMGVDQQPDGYETPLSGTASICNCAQRQPSCTRTHHVTYEALPAESPYQLYAEIKEQQDNATPAQQPLPSAPIYDHLTFAEQTTPLNV